MSTPGPKRPCSGCCTRRELIDFFSFRQQVTLGPGWKTLVGLHSNMTGLIDDLRVVESEIKSAIMPLVDVIKHASRDLDKVLESVKTSLSRLHQNLILNTPLIRSIVVEHVATLLNSKC